MKQVKFLIPLMLLFVSVGFSSCNKDDDDLDKAEQIEDGSDNNQSGLDPALFGTWQYSYKDSYGGTNRIERSYNKDGSWSLYQYYTEKNGNISDSTSASGKWYTEGDKLICNYTGGTAIVEATYRVVGSTLYLDFGTSTQELKKIR